MKIRDLLSASLMLSIGVLLTWIVAGALELHAQADNAAAAAASADVALHQPVRSR